MKLSDFGLCKPVDVSLLPTLTEGEEYSDARCETGTMCGAAGNGGCM